MLEAKKSEQYKGERIAKVIARSGLCSRRDAERWIADGRIRVNGHTLDTPAVVVVSDDKILIDGQPLPSPQRTRLWRYHKPAGLVTSHRDEKGRTTVFDNIPVDMPRVISVGRLDLTSEGLLLLTNDGNLARHLELPSTRWTRRYRARVYGRINPHYLETLAKGITIGGVRYGPINIKIDLKPPLEKKRTNTWLEVSLEEGKNREIRQVLAHQGLTVNRLIRTAYGPFQLGKLARGGISEIRRKVILEQISYLKHES